MKRRGRNTLAEQLKYSNRASHKSKSVEPVQTCMYLPRGNKIFLPSRFRHENIRTADSLVEYWINQFTEKGQVVFDPFAGYGTTLVIAEEMGRIGYGIEFSRNEANYVQGLLHSPEHLIHGDSRNLKEVSTTVMTTMITTPRSN